MARNYDAEWTEGCSRWGPVGYDPAALMLTDQWVTNSGFAVSVANSLYGPGLALTFACTANGSGPVTFVSNLAANYARVIGSFYAASPLNQNGGGVGMCLMDNGTFQIGVFLETTGRVTIRAGGPTNTVLATSAGSIGANQTKTIGYDIGISDSVGYWKVTINGVLDANLNATGQNTRHGSANNYFNQIAVGAQGEGGSGIASTITIQHWINDLYLATGGGDTYYTTRPIVETLFPNGDSAVAFTPGAGVLGSAYSNTASTNAPGANELFLRKFTPPVGCTIASVATVPGATSAGAKFKGVIYSDSAGSPNALLSSGTEVVGATSGTMLTGPLVTPQTLTGGTPYWIGFITDTSVVLHQVDATTTGSKAANTYASGAPVTAPSMTTGQVSWELWGNLSAVSANYPQTDFVPPNDDLAYNASSTVSQEDLLTIPALATTPANIYGVNLKVRWRDTDAGARTADLRLKSGATTSSGNNAGLAPPAAYGGASSGYATDPNGSIAWTAANLAASKVGYKIAS